jgi:hypothetical protein
MMIALCIVLRYFLSPFPNVKPIAAILILLTLFVSTRVSIITGSCVMLITGMFYGFGIWIPLQMLGFLVISIGARFFINKGFTFALIWGILACYIYGFIVNLSMITFVPISSLIPTWISGLSFDTIHALSTLGFLVVLYKVFQVYGTKVSKWIAE